MRNWLKENWVKLSLVLILIIGGYFVWDNRHSSSLENEKVAESAFKQANAYNGFVLKENTASTYLALIQSANTIPSENRIYKDCEAIQQYQKYEDMDTRDMTIQNLEEAIKLSPDCAYQIVKEKQTRLENLDDEISKLFGLSEQMQSANIKSLSKSISNQWRDISTNEADFTNQIELFAENTRFYWDTELDYKKKKTTLSGRNELFNSYDQKAASINDKLVELDPKRKILVNLKNDTLNQLRALNPTGQ